MTDQASGHAIYTFILHMIQIIGRCPAILQIYVNAQKPEISSKFKTFCILWWLILAVLTLGYITSP